MQNANYKTRPDGSIDTAYYMAKGRFERSIAAHKLAASATSAPAEAASGAVSGLLTWFREQIAEAMLRRRTAN